jgi:spore maturation protein SpmA
MALNYIWAAFFLVGFVVALVRLIVFQDTEIFPEMLQSTFSSAKTGFEISLGLTGVMAMWLGLMKIGERGGIVPILSRVVGPFFARLFPEIPRNHPATGSIIMNFSANILGLDNAAQPLGLKAMKELQDLNPSSDTASNAQIMFLVLNTSGLTIIPISVLADRAVLGSINPTSIFIPTIIATFFSTLAGLIYVSFKQKIKLWDPVILAYGLAISAVVIGMAWYFGSLPPEELQRQSSLVTAIIILSIIVGFISLGVYRRLPLYEVFVDGAKEGFEVAIKIIPYLVAMLVGIAIFKTSGALEFMKEGIRWAVTTGGLNDDFVDALPVAFLKPLSGSASRSMMLDVSKEFGPDSFAGNLASIFRSTSETTFYMLAVYFGSVNVRKTRYSLAGGLIADVFGVIAAIIVAYIFFH